MEMGVENLEKLQLCQEDWQRRSQKLFDAIVTSAKVL